MVRVARKLHKWLMLFIGIQFAIWSVTGIYMVYFDIHYIHGDSLVKNEQQTITVNNAALTFSDVLTQFPNAQQIRLGQLQSTPVYRFILQGKKQVINAQTGAPITGISLQQASDIALREFTGEPAIVSVALITDNPPFELSTRRLPAWRIDFAGLGAPTIYVSSITGEIVTKRHDFWRIFDWMFRLHVMDYDDGSDIDNVLLSIVGILSFLSTLFGVVLIYQHIIKPQMRRISSSNQANISKQSRATL